MNLYLLFWKLESVSGCHQNFSTMCGLVDDSTSTLSQGPVFKHLLILGFCFAVNCNFTEITK